jgi:hypothetical protein
MLPLPGSPLVGGGNGCGSRLSAFGSDLSVDERGLPRPSTGTCDIGAVELEPPVNTTQPILTGSYIDGTKLTCSIGTWTGDGLKYSEAWSRNGKPLAGVTGTTYTTVTADDDQEVACEVTATGLVGSTTVASSGALIMSPTMLSQGESHAIWRESGKPAKRKPPVGTTFSFTVNISGIVTLGFFRVKAGRFVKNRCVAANKHNKRKPKCGLPVGSLNVSGVQGQTNRVAFDGKFGRRKLPPGKYGVSFEVRGPTGLESAPTGLVFTIKHS